MYREIVPSRLKHARIENKLTQKKVAEYLKVNRTTITNYERGINEPDLETIGKLAQLYCHSVDWFLGLSDD